MREANRFAATLTGRLVHLRLNAPNELSDAVRDLVVNHECATNVTVQRGVLLGLGESGGILVSTPTPTPTAQRCSSSARWWSGRSS